MNWLFEFVKAFWILFPAYAANAFPPLAKGKHPIDFGKNLGDGKRIFGDGKTIEGFLLGLIAGFLVGVLEMFLYNDLNAYASQFGLTLPTMNITVSFMISFGALFGDLLGSFIKRRFGLPRGKDAPLLDQLDFIFGTILFSFFFTEITIYMILIMFIVTPIIHRISCIIGYKLKIKREPW